jgi:hypothetical protein
LCPSQAPPSTTSGPTTTASATGGSTRPWSRYEPDGLSPLELAHAQQTDPTLALDFFRYTAEVRQLIAEGVRFKARHNMRTVARASQSFASSPLELQQRAAASVG